MKTVFRELEKGDIIVFDDSEGQFNIEGQRLIVSTSPVKLKEIDSCYHDNLPSHLFTIVTYRLTEDKKNLILGTRLSFDEIDPLALRVSRVDSLDEMLLIPVDN